MQYGRYQREHHSSKRRDSYQIDVITESYLNEYLKIIGKEMDSISLRLQHRNNRPRVRDSANLLGDRIREKSSLESIRAILDWDFEEQV